MYTCAMCKKKGCRTEGLENLPSNCPCLDKEQEEIKKLYLDEENKKLAYNSAITEADGYCKRTRLEEVMFFAEKCGYKKLGIAFCIGLNKEAEILTRILTYNGFDVDSVVCKNGSIPKEFIGVKENEKLRPDKHEPMCNPIGQAIFLNKAATELNIILGLCVGHDTLFIKHSNAPVTVFAVKDRVMAHNPMGALYTAGSYYKKKLTP